jgi:hypothetical protein
VSTDILLEKVQGVEKVGFETFSLRVEYLLRRMNACADLSSAARAGRAAAGLEPPAAGMLP